MPGHGDGSHIIIIIMAVITVAVCLVTAEGEVHSDGLPAAEVAQPDLHPGRGQGLVLARGADAEKETS